MRIPGRNEPPSTHAGTGGGRRPSRVAQLIYKATRRLEGHTVALGLLVAAVGLAMAVVAYQSVNGVPLQKRYALNAVFPGNSPVVAKGDTVRIAGRLAGLVTEVEPYKGGRRVSMELRPKFSPVGRDASAKVRVKSLVYLTYVELTPGNIKGAPMADGGTIPLSRAGSNVDLLEVVELFDRKSRETLKKTIYNTGIGLAGRGGELNEALGDLPPLTRQFKDQLRAVTREPGAIARSVAGASRVTRGLRGERGDERGRIGGADADERTTPFRHNDLRADFLASGDQAPGERRDVPVDLPHRFENELHSCETRVEARHRRRARVEATRRGVRPVALDLHLEDVLVREPARLSR